MYAHHFHDGAAIVVYETLSVELFTHAQTVNLKIDLMHWFHFFLNRCLIYFGVLEQRKFSFLEYCFKIYAVICPKIAVRAKQAKLFGTKPHLCKSLVTFDMRSLCFWNKSDKSCKYPAKIFVCMSIFGTSFSLLFLCVSRKMHRPTVSASAVNLLHPKSRKRTLEETLLITDLQIGVCNQKYFFLVLNQNICSFEHHTTYAKLEE